MPAEVKNDSLNIMEINLGWNATMRFNYTHKSKRELSIPVNIHYEHNNLVSGRNHVCFCTLPHLI